MSELDRICINPEPGDSSYFGFSIAINSEYLAVGDPNANRVCIYTRNNCKQWIRSKYILPPVNSVSYRIGRGFGRNLTLNDNVLLINDEIILISSETQQYIKGIVDPEEFQFVDSVPVFVSKYIAKLNSKAELQRIKFYPSKTPGFVEFTMLSKGSLKQIILPDNGESKFGYSSALYKNLFLVGSPCLNTGGGAWLFELDKPEKKPLKLSLPNTYMGTTVAISEQFAAVGDRAGFVSFDDVSDLPKKTLIKAIHSGATSVIDEIGTLSLSKNILAIMRPKLPDRIRPEVLKVFHLDDNAAPSLILCRQNEHIVNAFIQNSFLVTVEDNCSSGIRICLESMP